MALNEAVRPYQIKELAGTVRGVDDGNYADETVVDAAVAYAAEVQEAKPYKCPKCNGAGRHKLSFDTGNPADTELIQCTMRDTTGTVVCDGWGYTETQVKVMTAAGMQYEIVE